MKTSFTSENRLEYNENQTLIPCEDCEERIRYKQMDVDYFKTIVCETCGGSGQRYETSEEYFWRKMEEEEENSEE